MKRVLAVAMLVCIPGTAAVGGAPANAETAGTGTGVFQFVRTVQVAPDGTFGTGGFARVNYVPATDRLVVTFGTKPPSSAADQRAGYAYKEYDLDMNPTGQADYFVRDHAAGFEANDSGSVMVGNDYYFAWAPDYVPEIPGFHGWKLMKFDAVSWQIESEIYLSIVDPQEAENDPMVAFVNGQLDVSSQYNNNASGTPPDFFTGAATYHYFFSPALVTEGRMILDNPPQICGSSMIFVNGVYHLVTGSAFLGEVDVMHYDTSWRLLGKQTLRPYGEFSEGLAFDGDRFFVAYLDDSQTRPAPQYLPPAFNVHLAAFDLNWNLIDDVAVTNYSLANNTLAGRPWLILHNGRVYVSYDVDTVDPATLEETRQSQAYVSVYDVAPSGANCRYSVSSTSIQAAVAGGSYPLTIATGIGCPWAISNLPDWVTLAGPASGADSATVTLNVAANPGPWRSAQISAGGLTIAVNQASNQPGGGATALRFVPVTPCRVVDTRNAPGPFGGPTMTPGSTRSFAIPQSPCGIPGTAQAYSLNVTVVPEGPLYYLTLWPTGQAQANVSTLNSWGGIVVANAAIVPAGTGGAVSVYVPDTTDVILDINGYFDTSTGPSSYAFYPATPCRIADTRMPVGTFGGPAMSAGQSRDFPIPLSSCGLPPTASAYSLNVTVVPAGYLGYLTTWPTGQAPPVASTLNSWTGKVVANAAIVPAGTNESISVYVSNPTDVILDGNGYFAAPGSTGALTFYPVTPCRVADTRNPAGPFGGPEMAAATTRSFAIPASACNIPSTAAAYSLNLTVVPDARLSYLSAWATGSAQPNVSTLNSWDGSVVANAAIVPAGTSGAISVYVTDPTHVILDINGYFAP